MKALSIILVMLAYSTIQAQNGIVTTGGNAANQNGSASYSVGQVEYTTITGSSGTATQGVQQPYEFYIITEIKGYEHITLDMSVYPNPVKDHLVLTMKGSAAGDFSYELFDQMGKCLQKGEISSEETNISMQSYARSTYCLRVFNNKKEVKIFKIIKN
jgi:hypothetical protein